MTSDRDNVPTHYVGIGASAGGLEAIDAFFKNMDPRSGCAFIVVQHLSPDHKSLMAELLSKRTEMPVQRATEGLTVKANHVYLIPPNHDLRIFHGKLLLTEQNRHGGINLPIDIFLSSLAEDQGDKAVGIILSGTGSDGTRGVRAIKEKVGMVMAQSVETAGFDSMPRSAIATGLVDYILAPEDMPAQLISFIKHPYASKQEGSDILLSDEDGLNRIFALMREKTGIDFTYYKPNTVVRRIERRMTVNQIISLRDYVRYLEGFPREIDCLHRDLLIGVTAFFRDPPAYKELREHWLTQLLRERDNQPIRIWVAGCSTGEEAYSIAILCQEAMSQLGKLAEIKIFATDVDKEAIAHAGAGIYPESISADVPPDLLGKYFYRRDEGYQIARHIREMVVFAQHNLVKDPPFTNIELISCRNLLIYLQSVLQQRVLELFNFSLNPSGLLFLGSSETTGDMAEFFEPLHNRWKIYRSRGRKRRDMLSESTISFSAAGRLNRPRPETGARAYAYTAEDERIVERLLQGISGDYLPFTMVLNDHMELLHVLGNANDYLRFPAGKMLSDASKLAHRDLAIPLATGVQKVLKERKEVNYGNIHLRDEGKPPRVVDMRILPLPTRKGQDPLLAVFIAEHRPNINDVPGDALSYDVGREAEQRIGDLEQELQFTRENLQATVEELETSNEELQATNEELLASNEELQSTNEELQSVNEELYTVNAELQGKITELTEVNNDLDNLLLNTHIATLFLDRNLEIRRFTPEITRFIRMIDQDIGRPFDHLAHDLLDVDLDQLTREVNASHTPVEREVKDRAGRCYLMRIYPYRISPNLYSGILLTFVDIESTKDMQRKLELGEERHRLAQEAAQLGDWDWNVESGELSWSPNIERLFGFAPGEFGGTYDAFLRVIPAEDRVKVKEEVNRCLADPARSYFIEHRIIRPNDGEVRWMQEHGAVHADMRGKPLRMVGVVKDVTEIRATARARIRTERLFRATLDNLKLIALHLDEEGRVLYVNPFFSEFSGWTADELMGRDWLQTCVPPEWRAALKGVIGAFAGGGGEMHNHFENPILCKSGEIRRIFWNNTPFHDEEGTAIGVISIGQPVP